MHNSVFVIVSFSFYKNMIQHIFYCVCFMLQRTHQHNNGDGPSEAPDQCVMDREPAKIWVAVALWI